MSFSWITTSAGKRINWAQQTCWPVSSLSSDMPGFHNFHCSPFVCGTNTAKCHMVRFIWNTSWHSTTSPSFKTPFVKKVEKLKKKNSFYACARSNWWIIVKIQGCWFSLIHSSLGTDLHGELRELCIRRSVPFISTWKVKKGLAKEFTNE